jgi:hypothetical protein
MFNLNYNNFIQHQPKRVFDGKICITVCGTKLRDLL